MKNARIIVVLVLLALSLSGCANAGHSEVSAPSLQETVTAEPVQSTVPQGARRFLFREVQRFPQRVW